MTASITCPRCGMASRNPNDVREGYCGNCHAWTTPECPICGYRHQAGELHHTPESWARRLGAVVEVKRRPTVERLAEGWDRLAPELDPIMAGLDHTRRMRLMELVLQVGMAVEELRADRGTR